MSLLLWCFWSKVEVVLGLPETCGSLLEACWAVLTATTVAELYDDMVLVILVARVKLIAIEVKVY